MPIMRGPQPGGAINVGADLRVLTKDKDGMNFSMVFYPDVNNDLLRQAGLPMHFYYLPDKLFLAKDFLNGNEQYKFHMQEIVGILTPDGNVATPDDFEVAGGYLTFSTTLNIDETIVSKIKSQLQAELEASYRSSNLLGWNSTLPAIKIGPVQITKFTTTIDKIDLGKMPETGFGPSPGAFVVQGEGEGNINPTGTNAYSVMLGALPVQMVKAAAKSGESNIVVRNNLKYKIHTVAFTLTLTGKWESVFTHLSAAFKGRYSFASADVQVEFNKMVKTGVIDVVLSVDKEFVSDDKEKQIEEHKEAIIKIFMDEASKAIIEPAAPAVEPAKAEDKGGWFWNASGAFKFRKDRSQLNLQYSETQQLTIERTTAISSTLDGLHDQIKENPENEKRYFSMVHLDEGFQKIHVVASANANWGNDNDDGDPIEEISLQVGYPDSQGNLVFKNTGKYKDNTIDTEFSTKADAAIWDKSTKDRIYVFDFMRNNSLPKELQNKVTLIKKISFKERPNVLLQEATQKEETEERILDIRGESAGKFGVKISLDNVPLPPKMKVVVTCHADGIEDATYEFNAKNTTDENLQVAKWEIYYDDPANIKPWKYKVDVSLAGKTVIAKTLKWTSGWIADERKGREIILNVSIPEIPAEMEEKVNEYLADTVSV